MSVLIPSAAPIVRCQAILVYRLDIVLLMGEIPCVVHNVMQH
jgi:hypothetical protein